MSRVMKRQSISVSRILRLTIALLVVSCAAAGMFILFRHTGAVRGPAAGVGVMSSLIGSAMACWFAIRARDGRLSAAALLSALPLAFWIWAVYDVIHADAV